MGDYQEKVRGKWQGLSSRLATPVIIQLGGMQLPVSSLEAQLHSYELAGQDTDTSKIEAIRAALKRQRTAVE